MSSLFWYIILFYFLLNSYKCCPTGYIQCATTEDESCNLSGNNIISYGHDDYRWAYKQVTGNFVCNNALFPTDPVTETTKNCCYQNPKLTNIPILGGVTYSWLAGEMPCNKMIYGYTSSNSDTHIWRFTAPTTTTVTFSNCLSAGDTQMHLYTSNGQSQMASISGCENGDDCACLGKHEQFEWAVTAGNDYYIRILPYDNGGTDYGEYQLTVTCSQIATCQNNIIVGKTTNANRLAYIEVVTQSKWDITFATCDSEFHGSLRIYNDSEHNNKLIGGSDNNCGTYDETYTLNATEANTFYVEIDDTGTCSNCYGAYILTITCSGSYPTLEPTPIPTDSTNYPTINPITNNPTAINLTTINPTTNTPTTKNPTTINPTTITPSTVAPSTIIPTTIQPINSATNIPTVYPTEIPTSIPNISPSNSDSGQAIETTDQSNESKTSGGTNGKVNWIWWLVMTLLILFSVCIVIVVILYKRNNKKKNKNCIAENMEMGISKENLSVERNNDDDVLQDINKTDFGVDNRNDEEIIEMINQTDMGNHGFIIDDNNNINIDKNKELHNDEDIVRVVNKTNSGDQNMENDGQNEVMEGIEYDMDEYGAKQVCVWLDSIGFSKYYDNFVQNGFDSMEFIKQINFEYDLNDIGIDLKAHRLTIMNHVNALKN